MDIKTWFLKVLVAVQKIISNSGSILLTRAGNQWFWNCPK
jgi:hypothetical protein